MDLLVAIFMIPSLVLEFMYGFGWGYYKDTAGMTGTLLYVESYKYAGVKFENI